LGRLGSRFLIRRKNKGDSIMLTLKNISMVSIFTIASLLTVATVQAGNSSGHDHRAIPVSWTFDPAVQAKIGKNLSQGNQAVGLSIFEQSALFRYGIQVGNSFKTKIRNHTLLVTRTTTGLRIEGPAGGHLDEVRWDLPMRVTSNVIQSSMEGSHPGHEHVHKGIEWIFPLSIEQKIANNLNKQDASGAIGLNYREQKLLERYGIRLGNTFNAKLNGMTFTLLRTTMGMKILKHVQKMPMASIPSTNTARY